MLIIYGATLLLANPYFIHNARIKLKHAIRKNTIYTYCCLSRLYHPKQNFSIRKTKYYYNQSPNFDVRNLPKHLINAEYNSKVEHHDPIIMKICENQNLLVLIEEFIQLLKRKGVNVDAGESPSMLQVARLATDYEVKRKLEVLSSEFQKAGIQFDAETAQKFMMYARSQSTTATAAQLKHPSSSLSSSLPPPLQPPPQQSPKSAKTKSAKSTPKKIKSLSKKSSELTSKQSKQPVGIFQKIKLFFGF